MLETCLIVDAMNVIGSRPNGWWRNRDAAIRNLARRLQTLAETEGELITLVVDGRPIRDLPSGDSGHLRLLYAAQGGPNAADDRIIDLIDAHPNPETLAIVTSDRTLTARALARGATVYGATWLLHRLDTLP